jgi:hypothetical protein
MSDHAKDREAEMENSRKETANLHKRISKLIQNQLADASLKLQAEIKVMEAAATEANLTKPVSQKAIHEMRRAIVFGYKNLTKIQAEQTSERKRFN